MSTIEVAGSAASPSATEQGLFQCGSCKRTYNRLDHLARHVRSHTNFKPHRCSVCGKSFSRTDLLKRHVAAHDVRNSKVNNNLTRGDADDVPGRVSQACRACAANHVRCSEAKPCRRCAEKGLECIYTRIDDVLSPAPAAVSQTDHLLLSPTSMPSSLEVQMADMEPMSMDISEGQEPPLQPDQGASPSQQANLDPHPPNSYPLVAAGPSTGRAIQQPTFDDDFMGPHHPELPTGCCTPAFSEWNFLPGLWSADGTNGIAGVEQPFPGIELDDLDLRFLDTYNTTVPFQLGHSSISDATTRQAPSMGVSSLPHPASSASEAFRNHDWRFRPNPKDHSAAEEHNLSLPPDTGDHPSPESHMSSARRATPVRLGSATRDNILTIVIQTCRPENLPKAIASFPSVELLDILIQFYLTSPHARADSFIHAATFDPNAKKPELLLAMAAAGAVLTSDPTLTKLGYAMVECIRRAIPAHWERDNTLVRNLELTQAFLINLETGLWSGLGRKVEITESFLQSPLTMFRRGGRFRKSSYPASILDANNNNNLDQTTSDEATWQAWIQQESFKRTAFRLVQHDLHSSMYLMVNPLISYAELSLPLPCSPALWTAPSAQHWRSLLTQHPSLSHQPPAVADYLDDPGAFKTSCVQQQPESIPTLDLAIANEAFLACAWSLAWECIQLTTLHRSSSSSTTSIHGGAPKPRRWNTFLLTSRREELLTLLEPFRLDLAAGSLDSTPIPSSSPQQTCGGNELVILMRLELLLLHLHTPFEDVQLFAGIEGPDQARGAYPSVSDWARTEAARKAVCHAGQVVRFARRVGRGMVRGPGAVVMYQASLVLWVFALLFSRGNRGRGKGGHERGGGGTGAAVEDGDVPVGMDAVWLDGKYDAGLQRFAHFGVGTPYLTKGMAVATPEGGREGVSLGDPEGVLGAIIGILRDNYEGLPKPHLVERLLHLMEALQRSSVGMMEFHGQLDRQ